MRHRAFTLACLALLTVAVLGLPGCKPKVAPVTTPDPSTTTTPSDRVTPRPPRPAPVEVEDDFQGTPLDQEDVTGGNLPTETPGQVQRQLNTIYFAYDSSELTSTARATLQRNAGILNQYSQYNVVIQGHCDERGTIEYNLALGQRRGDSVREYLANLGVGASRIRVVSYGEERPIARDATEAAWSQNRRAEFEVE